MSLFSTNRVLVPVDFSEESFEAQKLTLEYVKEASNLYILYVLPNLNPAEPGMMWNTLDDETRINNVQKLFEEKFPEPEYQEVHFNVTVGDPSSEIIDYAKRQNIDLIVIPSHGRTGLGRFFMGSVAEKVVRYAHCPVLVLRRDTLRSSYDRRRYVRKKSQ